MSKPSTQLRVDPAREHLATTPGGLTGKTVMALWIDGTESTVDVAALTTESLEVWMRSAGGPTDENPRAEQLAKMLLGHVPPVQAEHKPHPGGGPPTSLDIDPGRAGKAINGPTGIFVVANKPGGGVDNADVGSLTKATLKAWLKEGGATNQRAQDLVGNLLGHGPLGA